MQGERLLLLGLVAFGSVACQALWGMQRFSAGDVAASGGGFGGVGAGGQGSACKRSDECSAGDVCWEGDCVTGCDPTKPGFCDGATLFVCNAAGDDLVSDSGEVCATPELCETGRFQGLCTPPLCEAGAYQCYVPSEGPIRARVCPSGRTEWKTVETCETPEAQCSPEARGCFALGMDETEVTQRSYSAFLEEMADRDVSDLVSMQPPVCAWNTTFTPSATCLEEDTVCSSSDCHDHPQVCVDWCDAFAYCQAHGMSLCGTLGDQKNGGLDRSLASDPTHSSWANACRAETPAQCEPAVLTTTTPVGQGCSVRTTGYEGLRGISGNVSEWEYACDVSVNTANDRGNGYCFVRGGSFVDSPPLCLSAIPVRRNAVSPEVGFRCCAVETAQTTRSGGAGASSR